MGWRRGPAWALGLACTCACQGAIGGVDDDTVESPVESPGSARAPVSYPALECDDDDALDPGRSPLRRLTVPEYDNTVRDLLGDNSQPAQRLVDDERGVTSADARLITTLLTEQYLAAAEEVAADAVTDLDALRGCGTLAPQPCTERFVTDLIGRAFRRPAEPDVVADYVALHDAVETELGLPTATQAVVEAVLQSPDFLYRVEQVPSMSEPVVRLDGFQLATRLSYLLWSTMPDDALRAAAEAGELDDDTGLEAHARRMLADARSEPMLQRFFAHYLELEKLDNIEKDAQAFPAFDPAATPALLRGETEAFLKAVLVDGSGSWREVMTAPFTFANAELAAYYGHSGPSGNGFERVDLDPRFHAGLLTQGSVLATRARAYETSPIHRGMFVRGTLLCGIVPDVPEGLEVTPPDPDPSLTTRQRLAEHRANPVCGSCHRQIDPLGFAFEHFDGAGVFRAEENELPIDASGELVLAGEADGPFDGAVDLAQRIVDAEQGQACFASHWMRETTGRALEDTDGCDLRQVVDEFRDSDLDVRELIVRLTLTDAFRYRRVHESGGSP